MKKIMLLFALVLTSFVGFSQQKIKGLACEVDQFTKHTYYTRRSGISSGSFDLFIFIPKGEKPQLYARIGYRGDDWIFFEKIKLQYELIGAPIIEEIKFDRYKKQEKVVSGGYNGVCNEYVDVKVDEELLNSLDVLVSLNTGMLRLEGKTHYKTHTFNPVWLSNLNKILAAYHMLCEQYDE